MASDGKMLVSAGADNSVKFWDAATGEQPRQAYNAGKEQAAVRFIPLSTKVLTAGATRTLQLVDSQSKNGAEKTYGGPTDFLHALAISGDGKSVLGGGQDSSLWLWNVTNGQMIRKLEPPVEPLAEPAPAKP